MQRRRGTTVEDEGGDDRNGGEIRRRRQPREEILESSDEEDEYGVRNGRSGGDDTHSQSSTSIMDNLSKRSSLLLSKDKKSRATNMFDVIRAAERRGGGGDEAATTDDSTSEDEDGELMNPYVMNPFPNRRNDCDVSGDGITTLDYSGALLPPSMELAALSGGRGGDGSSAPKGDGGVTPLTLSPVRTAPKAALASFDPYGPNNGEAVPLQKRRGGNQWRQPYRELEMEEESIEFVSNTAQDDDETNGGRLNVFGPLLDEPTTPLYQGDRSSFSPFPKHQPRQTSGECGESTPLSMSKGSGFPQGFAARHGRGPGRGGIFGIAGAIANVIKAVLSSIVYVAYSLFNGDQTTARSNNPYSHGTTARISRPKHWGMLSYFRLFAVTLSALFCIGTVIMMYHVSNGDGIGAKVTSKRVYQKDTRVVQGARGVQKEELSHRPSSIVLKRMGEAKPKAKSRRVHWWSRNTVEPSAAEEVGRGPHTEVYQHVEKRVVVPQAGAHQVVPPVIGEVGTGRVETLPVVVRTEEDGTLLIKLPPPSKKMSSQELMMGGAEPRMGAAENWPEPTGSALASATDGDQETMYIKLPYPQQQQLQQRQDEPHRRRTLTEADATRLELEPPPRGAAVGGGQLVYHPPPPLMELKDRRHRARVGTHQEDRTPGVLNALRDEFDSWVAKHGKKYPSGEEKEHRFHVWRKNHSRIQEKNQKHGPCRMTGKAVFGHNMFSDLDPEEFQSRFLTGYNGPRSGMNDHNHHGHKKKGGNSHFRESTNVSRPKTTSTQERPPPVKRHPSIQRKLEEHTAMYGDGGGGIRNSRLHGSKYQSKYLNGCSWWDVSCILRWIFSYQYIGGTREPVYDENSYPSALDWRSMGVVTEVHSQGSCGACWAITAVETIESANAIATGELIDLAEEEVIACDGTCEMCNGGWPQNAYEYVMTHNGLPEKSSDYDADWLYTITAVLAGESYEASEYEMGYYFAGTCPKGYREGEGKEGENGGNSGSQHSGSGDGGGGGNQYYDVSYVETTRYGAVKGYGYATDRCICYTDGSGCDCDEQDEKTAVLNVASYGPAAVCLEASLWQDYEGGIMTSEIGCSSSFLDMNHCVEVVGYAFTDGSSNNDKDGEEGGNSGQSGSGSGSNDRSNSGSRDGQREGYWIVKNQWSNYWGMNGYAYVAMGENTCGILNDMTQVYMND